MAIQLFGVYRNGAVTVPEGTQALVGLTANGTPDTSISPSTESHIGQIGGEVGSVSAVPTVTAATYSTGNVIGSLLTFTNLARITDKTGHIEQVLIHSKSSQSTPIDLIFFHSLPSSTTFTNASAYSLNVADFDKISGVAHVVDWTNNGTPSVGQALNLNIPFLPVSGTRDVYGVLVARGTLTLTSTSDISVRVKGSRD